jgi:hypothetical protein
MSEPENFLTRWSRRKQVAEEPEQPAPAAEATPEEPAPDGVPADKPNNQSAPSESKPVFDPASLPSLDSIDALTDIRAFLQPGVPSELRLAALRRAWSADPAIRDFKGLAENDWDFTAPNSMLGFGELDAGVDVQKMLAQMFGETPRAGETPTEIPATAEPPTPLSQESSVSADRMTLDSPGESAQASEIPDPNCTATTEKKELVRRDENIASQDGASGLDDAPNKRRRSQGRALPE